MFFEAAKKGPREIPCPCGGSLDKNAENISVERRKRSQELQHERTGDPTLDSGEVWTFTL
jgi:hypothetical protein